MIIFSFLRADFKKMSTQQENEGKNIFIIIFLIFLKSVLRKLEMTFGSEFGLKMEIFGYLTG